MARHVQARVLLVGAASALAAAAPAKADGTLAPLEPCYVAAAENDPARAPEPVVVTGTGFEPNGPVDFEVEGITQVSGVPADAAGNVTATFPAPAATRYRMPFTVVAAPQDFGASAATASSFATNVTARLTPGTLRPRRRATFSGRGFTAVRRPVYAHYLRRGQIRATRRLVRRAHGRCGAFSVRRRQFPFAPEAGRWTIQIDQSRRYRRDVPAGLATVRVTRFQRPGA